MGDSVHKNLVLRGRAGNAMPFRQLNNSSRLAGNFSAASSGACTHTQWHRDKLVVVTLVNSVYSACYLQQCT
jgi:hypothetical protein